MRRRTLALVAIPLLAATAVPAQPGPMIVGEEVFEVYETGHPYRAAPGGVTTVEIGYPGASYIAPHFGRFELAPGDFVVVRSPDGARSWRYEGTGKAGLGVSEEGFWGIHVPGDRVVVELHSRNAAPDAFGFAIDRFARGFTASEVGMGTAPESLCGTDDSENAICYDGSPEYDEARAVARLLIQGFSACTGWLVGDAGHLVTNNHCIGSSSAANNTDYEFMAEADTCSANCNFWWACPGVVEATSGTLVQTDFSLDYTLIELPTDPSDTYGFMQLRETPAILGEQIYSGQHPGGWAKRIGIESTHAENPTGFAEVDSLSEPSCQGGGPPEVGYYMDTQGGSSGSPVLGTSDDCVVALHHCRGNFACTSTGGDPNRGVPIPDIITDMGSNLPPNAICDTSCAMAVSLDRDLYFAGDTLRLSLGVEHRKLDTVSAPFVVRIQEVGGRVLVERSSRAYTFAYGDRIELTQELRLPADLRPGDYRVVVVVDDMKQGTAKRMAEFTVLGAGGGL